MTKTIPRRHRGAPVGNANALKHGRYVKRTVSNLDPDAPLPVVSLQQDIDCVRSLIFVGTRMILHIKTAHEAIHLIRSVAAAAATLQELIKLQRWLATAEDPATRAINQSLQSAPERMSRLLAKFSVHDEKP